MKKVHRFTAVMLSAAVAAGCMLPVYAASDANRDETIYITLNADGSIKEQIASVWLHSDSGLSGYEDHAQIENPVNLKGSWEIAQNGDQLKFDGEGNDVYYQGTTQKTPPVTAEIQYKLDGQPITAQELLGKSGHVSIKIALKNNQKYQREIGGQMRTVYTPFATALAVNLPTGTFTNVSSEHGMVQTDSLNQIAAFVVLPGMRETMEGLLPTKLDDLYDYLLDEVEVEADVTDFTMPDIMLTAATSLEELEGKIPADLSDMDDMQGKLDQLKDATKQLQDGAAKLKDATGQMKDGAVTLDDAVGTLQNGAGELKNGAETLKNGTGSLVNGSNELLAGVSKVSEGAAGVNNLMGQVCAKNDTLNGGANALFAAVIDGAEAQLNQSLTAQGMEPVDLTPDNYEQVIAGVLAGLGEENVYAQARKAVEAQVYTDENRQKATQLVTGKFTAVILVRQQAAQQGIELTDEQAQQQAMQLVSTKEGMMKVLAAMQMPAIQQVLAGMQDAIQSTVELELTAKVDEALSEGGAAWEQLQNALAQASAAGQQLNALLGQLGQAKAFVQGVADYTSAVSQIYAQGTQPLMQGAAQARDGAEKLSGGAKELDNGAAQLAGGTQSLTDGAAQLREGTRTLVNGAVQLSGGSCELADGMNEYAEDGIGKITDTLEDMGIEKVQDLTDALQELADDYTGYTGTDSEMKSSVKFIMKVEAPEPAPELDENAVQADGQQTMTFWQRIKNLFK